MPEQTSIVDYGKCRPEHCPDGVYAAVEACPQKLFLQEEPYDPPMRRPSGCTGCSKCVDACPLKAITLSGA
ncbi:ferredoxin family protein [Chloroflexota bacterium]